MEEDKKIIEEMLRFNKNRIEPQIKNAIENLINKNKEQEKMIELMADYIDVYGECVNGSKKNCEESHCQKCIIDYFRKKAKGE